MGGAAVMWGLMAPLGKDAMQHGIGGFPMVGIRVLGAAICFWLASWIYGRVGKDESFRQDKVDRKELTLLLGAAMFAIVLNQCNFIIGLSITSPINASIMTTLMPIVTMALSALILKEKVTGMRLLGLLLGCCGATTLITASAGGTVGGVLLGDVMCVASQVSYAFYLTAFKKVIARHHAITCQKWMMLSATVVVMPFCLPMLTHIDWANLTVKTYLETAFVVVGGTFMSFLLCTTAQRILRPTVIAMYNYMQPIVACTVSVAIGLGIFTPFHLVAIMLVFLGVYLVNR